jgi:hypothetical protein
VARLLALSALAGAAIAAGAEAPSLVLEGTVPEDESRFLHLPFDLPDGTAELEVHHSDLSSANVLDWGLEDPLRFRGWGGGNEEPAVLNARAASRSYLAGPLPAGTWKVIVGKARLPERPARYRVELYFRTAPTLAPQAARRPYTPAAPLERGARWYAGDFHVHSKESGDARPTLDEIGAFARAQGLDFVVITDHNTTSHLDFISDAQGRHPALLFVPGLEITTYWGHANAYGLTRFVDFRLDARRPDIQRAIDEVHAAGALFAINHPTQDLGDLCTGCGWRLPVPATGVDGVEVANAGYRQLGVLYNDSSIAFWDTLEARGMKAAAVGGSDDHRAGREDIFYQSPIGEPATMVWAEELSAAAILDGVARRHTVVKGQSVADPMVDLRAGAAMAGDTVVGTAPVTLTATVTGGVGHAVRFVRNGAPLAAVAVDADPFVASLEAAPPASCQDRFRAEVLVGGRPRTITSHLWVAREAGQTCANNAPPRGVDKVGQGCACGAGTAKVGTAMMIALVLTWLVWLRRRAAPASAPGSRSR